MNKKLKFALLAVATIIIANGCDKCSKSPDATDGQTMDSQPNPNDAAPPESVPPAEDMAPADAPPPPAEVPEGGTDGH